MTAMSIAEVIEAPIARWATGRDGRAVLPARGAARASRAGGERCRAAMVTRSPFTRPRSRTLGGRWRPRLAPRTVLRGRVADAADRALRGPITGHRPPGRGPRPDAEPKLRPERNRLLAGNGRRSEPDPPDEAPGRASPRRPVPRRRIRPWGPRRCRSSRRASQGGEAGRGDRADARDAALPDLDRSTLAPDTAMTATWSASRRPTRSVRAFGPDGSWAPVPAGAVRRALDRFPIEGSGRPMPAASDPELDRLRPRFR